MPASGNTISAAFGLDLKPLQQGFAQAQAVAKAGTAKITAVMNQGLAQAERSLRKAPLMLMDRKAPLMLMDRPGAGSVKPINWDNVAANRFGGGGTASKPGFRTAADFRPARPGQYPPPGGDPTILPGGRGGRAGIPGLRGIGVLAAVYQLTAVYKSAAESAGKLFEANAKIFAPMGGGTAVSSGDLEKKLADIKAVNKELRERDRIEQDQRDNPNFATGMFASGMKIARQAVGMTLGLGTPAEQDATEAREKVRRTKEAADTLGLMAEKQKALNNIEEEGRAGDETRAAFMKAELGNRERLLQIAQTAQELGIDQTPLADAENERYENEKESIKQRVAERGREIAIEKDIIALGATGLSQDEQRAAAIKLQVEGLKEKQSLTGDSANKDDIQNKIGALENEATAVKEIVDAKNRELALDAEILNIGQSLRSEDQQHGLIIRAQIDALKETLSLERDRVKAAEQLNRIGQLQVEAMKEAYRQSFKSPRQINDEEIEQGKFGAFQRQQNRSGGLQAPHFDMNGKLIGGRDPLTGQHINSGEGEGTLDQTYTNSPDAYNNSFQTTPFTQGKAYQTPSFQDTLRDPTHMAGPTHMDPLGKMDRFGKKPEDEAGAKKDEGKDGKDGSVVAAVDKVTAKMQELWGG